MRPTAMLRRASPAMIVACLALFVALGGSAMAAFVISSNSQIAPNTIYGAQKPSTANDNIVNGSIAAADIKPSGIGGGRIADKSLSGADLADDTLTGTQINESTLGTVPNASKLGGVNATEFRPGAAMASQRTDACAQTGTWVLCAPVTITVPSGTTYRVDVHTSMSAWGTGPGQGLFCAASEGPSCINGHPSGFTLAPGAFTNVAHDGTAYFGPGTHSFGMAARFDAPIGTGVETAYTTTTIRWHAYGAQYAAG